MDEQIRRADLCDEFDRLYASLDDREPTARDVARLRWLRDEIRKASR